MKKIFKIGLEDYKWASDALHSNLNKVIGVENFTIMRDTCCIKISNRCDNIKNKNSNKYRVYILIQQLLQSLNLNYKIATL